MFTFFIFSIIKVLDRLMTGIFILAVSATPLYAFEYLAFGDLRGKIEPCGCSEATDLGGISRLKQFLALEHDQYPNRLIFYLGNLLSPTMKDEVSSTYLQLGLSSIQITASLLGEIDIQKLLNESQKNRKTLLDKLSPQSVLTNLDPKKSPSWLKTKQIARYRYDKKQHLLVFGYTFQTAHLFFKDPSFTLSIIKNIKDTYTQKDKVPHIVLLFSGKSEDLDLFTGSALIDTVIQSHNLDVTKDPSLIERVSDQDLISIRTHSHDPLKKTEVAMVPIAGSGVLRFKEARKNVALTVSEIMDKLSINHQSPVTQSDKPMFEMSTLIPKSADKLVTWVSKTYDLDPLEPLAIRYREARKVEFEKRIKELTQKQSESLYVGSETCKACHSEIYQIWEKTAHARALESLRAKHKHQDLQCTICHVTGQEPLEGGVGFISEETTPHLAHVGCEQCHGPGKLHIQNPTVHPKGTAFGCTGCHHPPHVATFDQSTQWKKIQHGKKN